MKSSYTLLPENYEEVLLIDLKNNKKQFVFINILSVVLIIPFIVLYLFFERSLSLSDGFRYSIILFISIPSLFLMIILHELIHGLFFKIFGKGKLKFKFHGFAVSCSMPTNYFNKRSYILIGLAPLVLLTIIYGVLSFFLYNTDYFILAYFPLALNFSGAAGDIYVVSLLMKMKKTVLVNDTGVAMKIYDKTK